VALDRAISERSTDSNHRAAVETKLARDPSLRPPRVKLGSHGIREWAVNSIGRNLPRNAVVSSRHRQFTLGAFSVTPFDSNWNLAETATSSFAEA
jgi:hypothetical protein